MSELLPGAQEPPGDDEDDIRRRALWGLAIIGGIAALVVLMMVLSIGTSGGGHRKQDVAHPGPISVSESSASGSSPSTASRPSRPSSASSSTSHRPIPTSTSNPCPSATPCAVANNDSGVVSALNRFRVSHGVAAVPGKMTSQAQQCALSEGSGPACAPHYAWQPVSTQNGPQVINMIARRGDGLQWLVDPAMKSFSIGWAYAPGASGSAGQYECAVLKVT